MADAGKAKLTSLTSVRFFAALYIVFFHLGAVGLSWASQGFQRFISLGYVSVSFFFVLSGFILVYTYAGRELNLRRFWRARLARLYPLYLLSLLAAAPLFFPVLSSVPEWAWYAKHPVTTALLVATMTQAWVPQAALGWNIVGWAVSAEIFLYVAFPILLKRFGRLSSGRLIGGALLSWGLALGIAFTYMALRPDGVVATLEYENLFWLNALKFNPVVHIPEFALGMAAGFAFQREDLKQEWASTLVVVSLAVIVPVLLFGSRIPYPLMHTGLLAPAFAALISGLALRPRWTTFLEWRPLAFLGESSYSLFLLHCPILLLIVYDWAKPPVGPGIVLLSIALAIAAGVLAFRFIEEPLRNRLR